MVGRSALLTLRQSYPNTSEVNLNDMCKITRWYHHRRKHTATDMQVATVKFWYHKDISLGKHGVMVKWNMYSFKNISARKGLNISPDSFE